MIPDLNDMPLPEYWVKEIHESGNAYYVDTSVDPYYSIWYHPYEDEQYLQRHPEDRGKIEAWVARSSAENVEHHTEGANREFFDRRFGESSGPVLDSSPGRGEKGLDSSLGAERGFDSGGRGLLGALAEQGAYGVMDRGLGMRMDRRTMRLEDKLDRRIERRYGGRYAPPSYARPDYSFGQFVSQRRPRKDHGGKILPFLGGMATGVVLDEVYHHHKDKKKEEEGKN
ncbi:hypothetical protein GYMLUDRAFT_295770 [Collybiopsis luxurians FD-317 M1]|nr:hypothetical protein GYMLUDRAFT_295770 [Collybiopsis luxurians FD-317 M1]